jgi:phage gp36-like protein
VAYTAQGDLDEYLSEQSLIQLTDDDRNGTVDSAIVTECIVGAEAEVNGLLATRYDVPFTTAPEIVKEICVVFTVLRLFLRRGGVPESFQTLVDQKREILDRIVEGKIKLPDVEDTTQGFGGTEFSSYERIFGRSESSGW